MNPRILVSVALASVLIFGSMAWLADRGMEKAMPVMEEQKKKARETQQQHSEMIRQSLEEMGASEAAIQAALIPPSKEELGARIVKAPSPRKPIGA